MPVTAADKALAVVQSYCRWTIAPAVTDVNVTIDGDGGNLILLPSLHVTAVSAVTNDGTLLDPTEYAWYEDGRLYLTGTGPSTFTRKRQSVVVTMSHGYATMPADVQDVIDRLAARGASDSGAVRQVGQVAYATTNQGVGVGGALTDFDKAQLAPYRIPLNP